MVPVLDKVGALTATGSLVFECPGMGVCAIQLSGIWTATLVFEVSLDKDTWTTLKVNPPNSSTQVTGATANGLWSGPVAGMQALRVRCSAFTSGTISVQLKAVPLSSGGAGSSGGGGGGAVTVADGDDVAEGATTDAAVGDATGTVNAHLRFLASVFADVWVSASHFLKVSIQNATLAVTQSGSWVLSAGSAVIGHVITDSGSTTAVTGNVAGTVADGANVTLGAKADAKSTATDTTAITAMQVLKQISASVQAPPSQAVTNAGTFAVQAASTVANGANAVEGTTTDAAVITDATGTIQQYLRGLIKLAVGGGFFTSEIAPTTIYNGKKTVTTAGTRVALASSQAVKSVTIKALAANTGTIFVGDGSVASTTGFALAAGDTVSLDIANLATVNLDSSVNGEGVTYLGVN